MQGGASCPPIRCSLEGEVTLAFKRPEFDKTALSVIKINNKNYLFS
jgi:hypothetical protein